jgi:hypothetical protein
MTALKSDLGVRAQHPLLLRVGKVRSKNLKGILGQKVRKRGAKIRLYTNEISSQRFFFNIFEQ